MAPAVVGQQIEKAADKPDHGRINLDDVGSRARIEPPGHRVYEYEDCDNNQGQDIIHIENIGDDPGRTGEVAGNQNGKAETH